MYMDRKLKGLFDRVTRGDVDSQALAQAASEQVRSMEGSQVLNEVEAAAQYARNHGQRHVGEQLQGIVDGHRSEPESVKGDVISLLRSRPQVLSCFEPPFAEGILVHLAA
jgi:hypothetical protein